MKYNVYINQLYMVQHRLTPSECACIDVLGLLPHWAEKAVIGGQEMYFLSRHKLCEELPGFFSKSDTAYRIFCNLAKKGLIFYTKIGARDYVSLTRKGLGYFTDVSEKFDEDPDKAPVPIRNSDFNPSRHGFKSEVNSDCNPTYNITTQNNITTDNIIQIQKENHDTTEKTKKTKNLQEASARASGLDCLTDPVFVSEMEAWTNGIIQVPYELEKMRDWLASSGKKYKDYKAFARNWIRRACEAAKKDWEAKQPKQIGLNPVEVNEVLEVLRRKDEERRRMGLI